ncbi:hypothetical protein FOXB_10300 [Fusarium oxysporum f. sp. conglutinans Fo5176]|uniref:Uncharacterized protein n=1 Tax=Fusarium oxysporum (strain Fo5176) TaxID=660025 RepID=F9FV69_FUSOF|nr:hypothetical protein FOXB_10300 [Fusarium oxysporum f. sp. conglutinans Fo5176]
MCVNSSQCDEFRKSGVFDPKERSKVRPDRRTRPSYKFRDKELWKEWKEFYTRVTDYICLAVTLVKTQLSIEPTSESFKSSISCQGFISLCPHLNIKFTYYTFLPIVLLASSSHAGSCGSRARVYKVQADAHYNEGLLDCPNGYGDVECPFGTAAHDVQQHPPVNDGDHTRVAVRK